MITRDDCILTALRGLTAGSNGVARGPDAIAAEAMSIGNALWAELQLEKDEKRCRLYEDLPRDVVFMSECFYAEPTPERIERFNQFADAFVARHRAKFPRKD